MPMLRYEDRGTDERRDKSEEYCKYCMKDGRFTDEGITMEQKIEKNVEFAKKMGMPDSQARKLANDTIPKLRRWKVDKF
jgi:hypothetical protein